MNESMTGGCEAREDLAEGCETWEDRIEPYFERPYWVVDILPVQVPADSPGQYFAVEEYYLQEPRLSDLRRKYLELLLKLNCYFDLEIPEKKNPRPEALEELVMSGTVYALFEGEHTLCVLNYDDTNMTVYDPTDRFRGILELLAGAEGLFFWQPPQDAPDGASGEK